MSISSGARIVLSGTEENRKSINYSLCPVCTSMVDCTSEEWDSKPGDKICYRKRAVDDIEASSKIGCKICYFFHKAVSSALETQPWLREDGVSCILRWNRESCRFDEIRISLAQVHIKLLSEEEVDYRAYDRKINMLNTSSDVAWKLIGSWIENCAHHHRECSFNRQEDSWLPTRLIDVGSPAESCVPRLVLPVNGQTGVSCPNYVALSYRWGSGEVGKLTSSNINLYRQEIPFEALTPLFQDSISATKRLGVKYLWIDSLCILQDCEQDWLRESASMGKVYERSYCNIAATAASEGNERLFLDRDPSLTSPFKLDINWNGHKQSSYCLFSGLWHLGITKTPLNRRGWVLQERLLSPRTLSFHTQLFWECRELQACEAFPCGIGKVMDFESEDIDDDSTLCPKSWRTEIIRSTNLYAQWTKIVEQFTVSGLTKSSDKLYALSGIVERMKALIGDNCLAGLWERNLLFDLLWYIEKGRQTNWEPSYRVSPLRAPSWSWASVEGRVHFAQGRLDIAWGPPLVEICAVDINSASQCDPSYVNHSAIIISGALEKMPELAMLPEYIFSMFPGAGSACCMDDEEDLQTNDDLYALPMRAMKSVNGEALLCLILTPISKKSEIFRRAGLLALIREELDEFEWANGEWHNGIKGLRLKPHVIRIQ